MVEEKTKGENQKRIFSSLVEKLTKLNPNLLIVFGSYLLNASAARDLDVLIVSEEFRDVYYQNRRFLLPDRYYEKRIDSYCFTPKELRALFDRNHPLIKAIMKNHISLIGELNEFL